MAKSLIRENPTVFRAIRSKPWIVDGIAATAAFKLRENDRGQLSILLEANCSNRICSARLNSCWGEILLDTEKVLKLGLDIKPDPLPDILSHAVILNLPEPGDIVMSELMATKLRETVQAVNKKFEKYGKVSP